MTYRIAIIGAGGMGRTHARHWQNVPGAELVGVLDRRPGVAREALSTAGFTDWDALLSQAQPDVIDVCTPTPSHREYVERAAAAGKAIFCEKPLARTLVDCDAVVAAVERSGVPFMAGHVLRYFPEYSAARRLVEAGAVGAPAAIRTARLTGLPRPGHADNWYADPARSGGVVLDMIIHDFDWLRWTFGPVARVFARGLYSNARYTGKMDYALVTLRLASGAMAHVTGSWAHPSGFRTTFEIAGDTGLIEHDSDKSAPLTVARRAAEGGSGGGVPVPESPMAPGQDPYFLELCAFVAALESGTAPPVTVYDAREATRIALAALESIETGKVVTLQ